MPRPPPPPTALTSSGSADLAREVQRRAPSECTAPPGTTGDVRGRRLRACAQLVADRLDLLRRSGR